MSKYYNKIKKTKKFQIEKSDIKFPETKVENVLNYNQVHFFEDGLLRVEDAAVGVVHQMHRIGGGESVEELNGYEASRLGGEKGFGPVRAGTCIDGDFIARKESGGPPPQTGLFELCGQFSVRDAGLVVFDEGSLVPAGFDGLLKATQETVLKGKIVHFSSRFVGLNWTQR